jgi:mono/diheme cytochrome c family protein
MMTTITHKTSRLTEAFIAMALAICATALLATGCGKPSNAQTADAHVDTTTSAPEAKMSPVKRGEYLVTLGGCNDCHTPMKMGANGPEPDMSRMLSGLPEDVKLTKPPKHDGAWMWSGAGANAAFSGPWGTSYAMNLTPDSLTGIGTWTEEIFMNTIRSGKHWGTSRPIMPPMPWFNYAKATDEDLKAIYAYLRTIPPVHNTIRPYEPPTDVASADAGNAQH